MCSALFLHLRRKYRGVTNASLSELASQALGQSACTSFDDSAQSWVLTPSTNADNAMEGIGRNQTCVMAHLDAMTLDA
eukprot:1331389-Amphidinium_carterae.1